MIVFVSRIEIEIKITRLNLLGGFIKFNIRPQTNSKRIKYFIWVDKLFIAYYYYSILHYHVYG